MLKKWLFCKTAWYLGLAKIFWMLTLPAKGLQSQSIGMFGNWLSHDVIHTYDNFNFRGIGEKLPPVLRIDVTLLNKYLNQTIKSNNLFINIKSWRIFVKWVCNSALKKRILSRMWRNLVFLCYWGTFFWILIFLFFYTSLVCVVLLLLTQTFDSNVKAPTLSGLSVSLISSGAMNFVSKSFINLSISSSSSLCTASNNVNTWSVEATLLIRKCLF